MSYKGYLSSAHWHSKKRSLKSSLGGKECFVCGTTDNIDTHHKTYKRIGGEDINTDLVFTCRKCHYSIHKFAKEMNFNIWNATIVFKKRFQKTNGFRWGKKEIKDYWRNVPISLLGR